MPTGYTAAIKDGISFKQFAMQCARGFGALIIMRDEPLDAPIPDRFEPSTYHDGQLARAHADLAHLRAMTPAAADEAARADFQQQMDAYFARANEREALKAKYQEMLNEVNAWAPPTADHTHLKAFMIQQLEESIKHDCDGTYDTVPTCLSGHDWLVAKISAAEGSIKYHKEGQQKEIENTESRNKWVQDLRESLKEAQR